MAHSSFGDELGSAARAAGTGCTYAVAPADLAAPRPLAGLDDHGVVVGRGGPDLAGQLDPAGSCAVIRSMTEALRADQLP